LIHASAAVSGRTTHATKTAVAADSERRTGIPFSSIDGLHPQRARAPSGRATGVVKAVSRTFLGVSTLDSGHVDRFVIQVKVEPRR
jgi:hypothetical protein